MEEENDFGVSSASLDPAVRYRSESFWSKPLKWLWSLIRQRLIPLTIITVSLIAVYIVFKQYSEWLFKNVVYLGCGCLISIALFALVSEGMFRSKFLNYIEKLGRNIQKNSQNEFYSYLLDLRKKLYSDTNPRRIAFNRQLAALVDAINPYDYSPRPYVRLHPLQYIDPQRVYQSSLKQTADTLVRVALLLTFATLTWALVNTASQLPRPPLKSAGVEATAPEAPIDPNDIVTKTSNLVSDLIKAASLKFTISAVGILLSIFVRLWGSKQETEVAKKVAKFANDISIPVDAFIEKRASGTTLQRKDESQTLQQTMENLIDIVRQNTEVNRDIVDVVFKNTSR